MQNPYLSVGALTKYIKRKFDADLHLRDVYVKGELSNVKLHFSGHIYFTLKDNRSRIQAAMFRSSASRLKFRPEEGMNVLIRGDVNVYEAAGQYQLYVNMMQPDGVGELYIAFEQLKERLGKEGLFNAEWKQPIPVFPGRVGVITAPTGAAVRDICTTLNRRYPLADVLLFPAVVQGPNAVPSIVSAIRQANRHDSIDVLIVGRGGGSIEDLWAFNEEEVAREIFSSRIPVISAVGHETDTVIADFVADLRAPTPTAAAELAVPDRVEVSRRILESRSRLHQSLMTRVRHERKRLERLESSYPMSYPERLYRPFSERLEGLDERLGQGASRMITERKLAVSNLDARLAARSPRQILAQAVERTDRLDRELYRAAEDNIRHHGRMLDSAVRTLRALNPLSVMERGYSLVRSGDRVIKSAGELEAGDRVSISFRDGTVEAEVGTPSERKDVER
ncbi:Exodeoxyribonuclease VII large subunit [Bhargavaea beijingensis]|uniref:Exodeoxyribonuclease 7 large subunit n=1 Tax=Bhargavaea beijingensis TaxID=426756 RepID=A0A1G7H0N8_9BACL|nr:exodeoxyribonuclease VII large subunit [Bhargavaea beijingensis]SDE93968.1 Exodeoxyribonuclease VII large subunit [Bhargavaea beijingensis]